MASAPINPINLKDTQEEKDSSGVKIYDSKIISQNDYVLETENIQDTTEEDIENKDENEEEMEYDPELGIKISVKTQKEIKKIVNQISKTISVLKNYGLKLQEVKKNYKI